MRGSIFSKYLYGSVTFKPFFFSKFEPFTFGNYAVYVTLILRFKFQGRFSKRKGFILTVMADFWKSFPFLPANVLFQEMNNIAGFCSCLNHKCVIFNLF